MNNLKIYKSSAGSGKTFTLTIEYLKIALQAPWYFKHILAVTFTNKATQEMKNRILNELFKLKKGEHSDMLPALEEHLQISPALIRHRAEEALSSILHNYTHFSVTTIDSFFQKVIRSFTREVGLRGGFTIEMDNGKVLDESIDAILLELGHGSITQWLVQFAESKVEEGKSWDIKKEIAKLGSELFKEDFKKIEDSIRQHSEDPDFFKNLTSDLKKIEGSFVSQMEKYAKESLKAIDAWGLHLEDFAYGASGPAGYFHNILYKGKYEPGERARKVLIDSTGWTTKKSDLKESILELADTKINSLMQKAIEEYDTNILAYNSARVVSRYLFVFGIMAELTKKVEEYRREKGVMLISDSSMFLRQIIAENDAPFIFEKAGTFYHHFLIDEFQDTSVFQWENFRHLIANSLAEGRTNLLVGDIKQSIYRWRGSDWKLLLNKVHQDLGDDYITEYPLATNWRSSAEVIGFNNLFFHHAPALVYDKLTQGIEAIVDADVQQKLQHQVNDISEAYAESFQKVGKKSESSGWVEVQVAGMEEDELNFKESAIVQLIAKIEDLQITGYSLKDMAILVRTTLEGRMIADALMQYKNSGEAKPNCRYEVISSEALYLSASLSVRVIISALQYLHLQDSLALGVLKTSLAELKQMPITHELFASDDYLKIPAALFVEKESMVRLPLYELVEKLLKIFELQNYPAEFVYLQAFQDAIYEYGKDRKTDLGSLMEWWQQSGAQLSIKAPEHLEAIKILTIHKSKGLEFGVVMIPFCNWSFDHNTSRDNAIWVQSNKKPFQNAGYLPVKYSSELKNTYFAADYYQELIQIHLDNLNLLYVALTRAKEGLYVSIPAPKDTFVTAKLGHVGELVGKLLTDFQDDFSGSWVADNQFFSGNYGKSKDSKPKDFTSITLDRYPSHEWRKKIVIKKRGKDFFLSGRPEIQAKINYGLLVHDLLAATKNLDQLEENIAKLRTNGELPESEVANLQQKLNSLMDMPQMNLWFNHAGKIKNEASIILPQGQTYRPDRVMWMDGKVVVVDFKTGQLRSEHQKQVQSYVQWVSAIESLPGEGYLVYIEEGKIERI